MDGERSQEKSELGSRGLESAVLAVVIERNPEPLSQAVLLVEMRTDDDADGPRRTAEIESAVRGLVEVGLLVRSDGVLTPTAAALRASELELGF